MDKGEAKEILEKCVILNYLVNRDIRNHLQNDMNPFNKTIFKSKFE